MTAYNNNEDFKDQFFENHDHIFEDVASSLVDAFSIEEATDEQRKEIVKKNIRTIITMSNVFSMERDVFNRNK